MYETKEEDSMINNVTHQKKMTDNLNEDDSNINNETQLDSNCSNSFIRNEDISLTQDSLILDTKEKKQKKKKKTVPIMTQEFREEIEKMVDKQFENEYSKINKEYEEKLEELLNEQEKVFNKNEMLKAKFNALEKYLKNYCKKVNIDYDSLLSQ